MNWYSKLLQAQEQVPVSPEPEEEELRPVPPEQRVRPRGHGPKLWVNREDQTGKIRPRTKRRTR